MQEAVTDFIINKVTVSLQTLSSSSEEEIGDGLEWGEMNCSKVQGCLSLLLLQIIDQGQSGEQ